MSGIIETMQAKENFHGLEAATNDQIDKAQSRLGLSFSSDYREYIASVGIASFGGHELTGICASPRLDVVSVTEKNRKMNPGIDPKWYVIEELNIDQATIWQTTDGSIYRVIPYSKPIRIAEDIIDYINSNS